MRASTASILGLLKTFGLKAYTVYGFGCRVFRVEGLGAQDKGSRIAKACCAYFSATLKLFSSGLLKALVTGLTGLLILKLFGVSSVARSFKALFGDFNFRGLGWLRSDYGFGVLHMLV